MLGFEILTFCLLRKSAYRSVVAASSFRIYLTSLDPDQTAIRLNWVNSVCYRGVLKEQADDSQQMTFSQGKRPMS